MNDDGLKPAASREQQCSSRMAGQELVPLTIRGDARGSLVAVEGGVDVPFQIARVYYIFGTQAGVARGFHAHRDLQQFAICLSGSCTMLLYNGHDRREVRLDRPDYGVFIRSMVWHEMYDFSDDAVLMVLASSHYDESDYIRDYGDFQRSVSA